ncbi:gamma-glutamylcyclotransferase [Mesorhizobium sp. M2D.F.Ca.ET.185.01.1.1]|uniref:gamma-glutamylcyclotransferase n=1 Tax=unclassified Mesorhizobium TaxID=325217 RepID=UPI000FCBA765|nr:MULTISPECIES: gamma-glutamylcyclotransferase [unclassified Mesorhizobium]TGP80478.1 gamma-glutamylcyclotransferase [bacterium M00.F.Ca.ET.227.01.1.1]TGQ00553.1 gamma-glutamylcyclotransferase [bacterium M00.F.Ca.ET.221.01.1.1]TGQ02924.1 gamma-glutamylcyclotransferase [bacterium M00.F.Ca.ET.222.01.1.1]TGT74394.1 gamma-glutamylcyclotransferase [bacterium M00.F.Ca.ET.159.01.1.1]TGT86644.1 gamma-glutamylcyclotransferase [bacterium M00.F.Ca.ET.157.01.1.1]TGU09316.1 gamma-glutamylcyclotransferase
MRRMSLTPELVALCHREEIDPGPSGEWTQLNDDDFGALAARLAAEADEGPLWVFAYGSLIWKPAFESVEQLRASAHGWHRSFCLDMVRWRGSAAQPGLMMALERGGRCDGVIYRLPDGEKPAQIERLLRREIDDHESVASVRWVPVRTAQGRVRALGFWVGVTGRGTSLGQPLEKVAWVLARACGHVGSGAEYLYNTVSHLETFGIHDRNLWRLQELVADEIRSIHGHRVTCHDAAEVTEGVII